MSFVDIARSFATWVVYPIDDVLSAKKYVQSVILSACAIDYMAQADQGDCLSLIGTHLAAYSKAVGYGGGSGGSVWYEAFCRVFMGDFGSTNERAATIYRTIRCGLVHQFSTAPQPRQKVVMPFDVILDRGALPVEELGSPPVALLVSVPGFSTAVRDAFRAWCASATSAAQSRFVAGWNMCEITVSTLTSMPTSGSIGTLSAPEFPRTMLTRYSG